MAVMVEMKKNTEEKSRDAKSAEKSPESGKIVLPGDFIAEKAGKKVWGGAYFEDEKV